MDFMRKELNLSSREDSHVSALADLILVAESCMHGYSQFSLQSSEIYYLTFVINWRDRDFAVYDKNSLTGCCWGRLAAAPDKLKLIYVCYKLTLV